MVDDVHCLGLTSETRELEANIDDTNDYSDAFRDFTEGEDLEYNHVQQCGNDIHSNISSS